MIIIQLIDTGSLESLSGSFSIFMTATSVPSYLIDSSSEMSYFAPNSDSVFVTTNDSVIVN